MSERVKVTSKTPESKRDNSVSQTRKTDFSQSINSPVDHVLFLQKTIGNQAVQRLFKSCVIQAKLKIGQPDDKYEQEADRVADAVMRMPEPQVERQPEEEEEELIQTKPLAEQITPLVQRQVVPEEEESWFTRIMSSLGVWKASYVKGTVSVEAPLVLEKSEVFHEAPRFYRLKEGDEVTTGTEIILGPKSRILLIGPKGEELRLAGGKKGMKLTLFFPGQSEVSSATRARGILYSILSRLIGGADKPPKLETSNAVAGVRG